MVSFRNAVDFENITDSNSTSNLKLKNVEVVLPVCSREK